MDAGNKRDKSQLEKDAEGTIQQFGPADVTVDHSDTEDSSAQLAGEGSSSVRQKGGPRKQPMKSSKSFVVLSSRQVEENCRQRSPGGHFRYRIRYTDSRPTLVDYAKS